MLRGHVYGSVFFRQSDLWWYYERLLAFSDDRHFCGAVLEYISCVITQQNSANQPDDNSSKWRKTSVISRAEIGRIYYHCWWR